MQNCAIPLLNYSVLCNFAKMILIKQLIKGVNCKDYLSLRFHYLKYDCNALRGLSTQNSTLQPDA